MNPLGPTWDSTFCSYSDHVGVVFGKSSIGTAVEPTSASKAATSSSYGLSLANRIRTPVNGVACTSDADMAYLLGRDRPLETIVDVRSRRPVDLQAEQLRAAVMPGRIHLRLAVVDQGEVEVGDHVTFARAQGFGQQFTMGRDDR